MEIRKGRAGGGRTKSNSVEKLGQNWSFHFDPYDLNKENFVSGSKRSKKR